MHDAGQFHIANVTFSHSITNMLCEIVSFLLLEDDLSNMFLISTKCFTNFRVLFVKIFDKL